MPQMNGLQALKSLQMVFEALEMGAKDFIVKPFDPDRVLKPVRRFG